MARSVMQHSFSQVPRVNIPRSSFNRSHEYKTTHDADYLIPVLVDDCVPGDTIRCNMNVFSRLTSPTVLPLMDNMYLESFFFFVPYRLVWQNFPKFHGAQDDPGDSIDFTIPAVHSGALDISSITGNDYRTLTNYFGIPPSTNIEMNKITALPYRSYSLIWDEWFRDQNLQDAKIKDGVFGTDWGGDGPDSISNYSMLKRGKRHDYFTACLPAPQRGDAVSLPLSGSAPVTYDSAAVTDIGAYSSDAGGYRKLSASSTYVQSTTAASTEGNSLYADLTDATAATINDLRLAFQTQRLLERDARSGTRYNEMILAHFGVTVPDFRVQRPEFLGGGTTRVNVSPVAQTTYEGTQTIENAKGALAGIGTASGRHGFTYSATEHGLIMGLINVRADLTYSQGIDRYWNKDTRYDFYYPVLSQIGEQSVLNQELWYTAGDTGTINEAVFGYQERYAEMRYKNSKITGLLQSDVASNLDEFHLSEDFASLPTLDDSFIQSNAITPLDRAISVPSQPQFVTDLYFEYQWARPMPLFGVPGQLDHL